MTGISIGSFLWVSVVAGIIGTAGMTLLLTLITKSGLANADMVRAIGSIATKRFESAYGYGLLIHFIFGIVFAFIYTIIIVSLPFRSYFSQAAAGTILGYMHGGVMAFVLVVMVSEHHPMEEFRKTGFSVAAAHVAAHILYGFLVGSTIYFIGY